MASPEKRSRAGERVSASQRRRGRPTADRAAAIDVGIRAAALEMFLTLGFEAASMDAIAAKARISKGTLYARFGNKEALFRAILDDELEQWSTRAGTHDHLLPTELAPRLRYHARTLFEAYLQPEYQRIARLGEGAKSSLPDVLTDWQEIATRRFLRFLAHDMATVAPGTTADWDFHAKLFLFALSGWRNGRAPSYDQDMTKGLAFADKVIDTIVMATVGRQAPSPSQE